MASRMWKDGNRRGIAYVEGRAAAERVMAAAGRRAAAAGSAPSPTTRRRQGPAPSAVEQALDGAMAVYSDRRGRPFAWQIPFDIVHWEKVLALVAEDGAAG